MTRVVAGAVAVLALGLGLWLGLSTAAAGAGERAGGEGDALASLFRKGVAAYDAGDFDGAVGEWEKLLRFRVESTALEYDLANAYFKKKDYGRAILHWERALRLEPGDRDTRSNLDLARTLLVDDVRVEPPPLVRVLERASETVSADAATAVAVGAWLVLGLGVLVARLREGGLKRLGVAAALIAIAVLLLAVPLVLFERSRIEDRSRLVVLTPAVEVLSGPGAQYTNVFTVHEGLVVRNRGSAPGWEWVELPNGLNGWVPADAVDRI